MFCLYVYIHTYVSAYVRPCVLCEGHVRVYVVACAGVCRCMCGCMSLHLRVYVVTCAGVCRYMCGCMSLHVRVYVVTCAYLPVYLFVKWGSE